MKIILLIACAVAMVASKNIHFKDCGSTAKIESVSVDPCDAEPCPLKKGTNSSISIVFTPTKASKTLKTSVKAHVGPIWIPYPGVKEDACNGEGVECPLVANQKYTYKYVLPIQSSFPSIRVVVSWELKADDGDDACVEMSVQVVDGVVQVV